mgnify:CR=1 FL=1
MKDLMKFALAVFVLIALIYEGCSCEGGRVSVSGTTGTTKMSARYNSNRSIAVAGRDVAARIYSVATKHKELRKVVVEFTLTGENSYGKKVETSIIIVEDDLDEVRKFADKDSYQYGYAGEVYAAMIMAKSGLY